ncbi:MAG: hypothetical protein A3F68_03520 [Acidobacteria bacterium RIFCSPLOWO2_12_FULL_54_10]|nr:MAG: hypothetical protein A3F68_03520 [Acidobacteria bacterium RIFCSPLOWO2_12_FULL_54_10]
MSSPPIRVAAVSYLNSVPLVWGLVHGPDKDRFDVQYMVPSQCSDALMRGTADAGIIPSIEYQRIEELRIVPGLSISSSGPVRSVLLISQCPIDKIKSLALDVSSRTSACLVQLLLQRQYNVFPSLGTSQPDLKKMLGAYDAALLIGDPALASDFPGLFVYDLAEEWRKMTGLPFVFAFWAVREDAATQEIVEIFLRAKNYAWEHLEEITQQESRRTGLPTQLIYDYLTKNIDFILGEENLKGLSLFYQMAQEMGLTECNRPLEFAG